LRRRALAGARPASQQREARSETWLRRSRSYLRNEPDRRVPCSIQQERIPRCSPLLSLYWPGLSSHLRIRPRMRPIRRRSRARVARLPWSIPPSAFEPASSMQPGAARSQRSYPSAPGGREWGVRGPPIPPGAAAFRGSHPEPRRPRCRRCRVAETLPSTLSIVAFMSCSAISLNRRRPTTRAMAARPMRPPLAGPHSLDGPPPLP
jgi:hypothetical protein